MIIIIIKVLLFIYYVSYEIILNTTAKILMYPNLRSLGAPFIVICKALN